MIRMREDWEVVQGLVGVVDAAAIGMNMATELIDWRAEKRLVGRRVVVKGDSVVLLR